MSQRFSTSVVTRQQEARVEREGGLADGDALSPVRRKRIVLDVAVAREERCAGGEREEAVQPAAALKLHHHLWDDAGHHPHEEEQRRQLSRACHGDLSPQPNSYVTLFAKCCLLSPVQHCYNPAESIHGSFQEQNVMTFNYRTHYDSVSISAKETERVFTTPGCNIQTPVCWCEYAAGGLVSPCFQQRRPLCGAGAGNGGKVAGDAPRAMYFHCSLSHTHPNRLQHNATHQAYWRPR